VCKINFLSAQSTAANRGTAAAAARCGRRPPVNCGGGARDRPDSPSLVCDSRRSSGGRSSRSIGSGANNASFQNMNAESRQWQLLACLAIFFCGLVTETAAEVGAQDTAFGRRQGQPAFLEPASVSFERTPARSIGADIRPRSDAAACARSCLRQHAPH
jgi:hypothetical protein